ncbi:MAG: non-ribosomal peptide synthetase, partial [Crocinitomicaceae bacterium]|nr:non-ribosomal peptide synthetase [Crocinitomicaceae bacterium]
MITKENLKDIYPLSLMQEGMLFQSLFENESNAYFEQTCYKISGAIDPSAFRETIGELFKRHDVLRTVFVHKKVARPLQMVLKKWDPEFHYFDLNEQSAEDRERFVQTYRDKDLNTPFDLSKDVLMRVYLFRLSENSFQVIWSHHHIIMDGWCIGILLKEFMEIYRAKVQGTTFELTPVTPYSAYIKWLEKADKNQAAAYWKNYLEGYETQISFNLNESARSSGFKKKELNFEVKASDLSEIREFCKSANITLNTFVQGAWAKVLQVYHRSNDVVFGSVVAGRPAQVPGVDTMVGLFINTLPGRIVAAEKQDVTGYLKQIQENALLSEAHSYYPLAEIQAASTLRSDLVSHLLVFENYPLQDELDNIGDPELNYKIHDVEIVEQTSYDLTVLIFPGEKLTIQFQYNGFRFSDEWIKRIASHLQNALFKLLKNPYADIRSLGIFDPEAQEQVLTEFNDTNRNYPGTSILDLYYQGLESHQSNTAVVSDNRKISFSELESRSNALANELISGGLKSGDAVGVMLDRSEYNLLSFLAILKAGGAYLPIDPNYPADRIAYMTADSKVGLILSETKYLQLLGGQYKLFNLDTFAGKNDSRPEIKIKGEDPSYLIYTSGSTGQPKGVVCTHQCLHNLMNWQIEEGIREKNLRVAQYASLSFDVSVQELAYTLTSFAALHVVSEITRKDMFALYDFVNSHHIELLILPFSALNLFFKANKNPEQLTHLKHIITSGEQLILSDEIRQFLQKRPDVVLYNQYGPSETHVVTCQAVSSPGNNYPVLPAIGKPVSNTQCYILDANGETCPVGIAGELNLGGVQLATGYLNREDLTQEKFYVHPKLNTRLYRTGDLAVWNEDGSVQFLGRIDSQVKIRGHRVEIGEVENAFLSLENIDEVAVIVKQVAGANELLACYTSAEAVSESNIRTALKSQLPDYMIPSRIMQLEKLPLTPSGKVDRKELAKYDTNISAEQDLQEPVTETEKQLTEIWKEILDRSAIGTNQNFFDLGGHSLKATLLVGRIQKALQKEISVRDVFEYPVIAELARRIDGSQNRKALVIPPLSGKNSYPLSPAQRRILIMSAFDQVGTAYNMTTALRIMGKLDQQKTEEAFQALFDRHEILRSSVQVEGNESFSRVEDRYEFRLEFEQINAEEELSAKIEQFTQPFDLAQGPLIRIKLIRLGADKQVLLFDMHHIISDGISIEIIIREFLAEYKGEPVSSEIIQYGAYAAWQVSEEGREFISGQEDFWLKTYRDGVKALDLPVDKARKNVQNYEGDECLKKFSLHDSQRIKKFCREQGISPYMFFLGTFGIVLSKYAGQDEFSIGTPVSGRPADELNGSLGVFVNTLALRLQADPLASIRTFFGELKLHVLEALENQHYPFDILVEQLNIPRDTSRHPLFDVMFSYQDNPSRRVDASAFGLEVEQLELEAKTSKFDLSLNIDEEGDFFIGSVEYSTQLFEKETIQKLFDRLAATAQAIINNDGETLANLSLLEAGELNQITTQFNHPESELTRHQTLLDVFREQVVNHPLQNIIVSESTTYTLQSLDDRVSELQQKLASQGSCERVALIMDRSPELIPLILAVWRMGGTYITIDPDLPENRISQVLDECEPNLIIREGKEGKLLISQTGQQEILLDAIEKKGHVSGKEPAPLDMAYIIFTSGSTGKPKGVCISHANLLHTLYAEKKLYGDPVFNTIFLTKPSFDVSLLELFLPLISGGHVTIPEKSRIYDYPYILELVQQKSVTDIGGTPGLFESMLEACSDEDLARTSAVRRLSIGGESLRPELVKKLKKKFSATINNHYGPTETTIDALVYKDVDVFEKNVIGRPIPNTAAYVVDANLNILPPGVKGELVIGGRGVGLGYWKNEELTQEKFVKLPQLENALVYRTGDIARWLPDGTIEFFGRQDSQVKINGYRVELGDIESTLLAHEEVQDAAVGFYKRGGVDQILAFFVSAHAGKTYLWPSMGEFPVYDDVMYKSMKDDQVRVEEFKRAIYKSVAGKTVVEVGPGSELVLTKLCVEAGAKKVYAIEIIEEAYLKAKAKVEELGYQDIITVIHGNAMEVELPEQVDYAVSEQLGVVGGSEGAFMLSNYIRRFLKDPAQVIPQRTVSRISAVDLNRVNYEHGFDDLAKGYVESIFEHVGYPFDVRVVLKNFDKKAFISDSAVFEDLDYRQIIPQEGTESGKLTITKKGSLTGFVIWLTFDTDGSGLVDVLEGERESSWLPLYLPVFDKAYAVEPGDVIVYEVQRFPSEDDYHPDYKIQGKLLSAKGEFLFDYTSSLRKQQIGHNKFYTELFPQGQIAGIPAAINTGELLNFVQDRLPQYMVPARLIEVDKIPLSANGKKDLKVLLNGIRDTSFVAPSGEFEMAIANCYKEILGLSSPGANDSFFSLGGNSIKAIRVISALKRAGYEVEVRDIFSYPTIRELAILLSGKSGRVPYQTIKKAEDREFYDLSSAQNRLWLLNELKGNTDDYILSSSFDITEDVQPEIMVKALEYMMQRHEILRTNFVNINGIPQQKIEDHLAVPLRVYDLKNVPDQQSASQRLEEEHNSLSFTLEQGPLFLVSLAELNKSQWKLFFSMHHIITDGWSMNILRNELEASYYAFANQSEPALAPLDFQYKDYAYWQKDWLSDELMQNMRAFWLQNLEGDLPEMKLPASGKTKNLLDNSGSSYTFYIDEALRDELNAYAVKHNASLFMVLYGVYNFVISRLTGSPDTIIGIPVSGRDQEEFRSNIGFFLNTVMVRSQYDSAATVDTYFRGIKDQLVESLHNQHYPFEQLVDDLKLPRNLDQFPISSIFFNFINLHDSGENRIGNFHPLHESKGEKLKFDLNCYVEEYANGLALKLDYRDNLLDEETVELLASKLLAFCRQVLLSGNKTLQNLELGAQAIVNSDSSAKSWFNTSESVFGRFREVALKQLEKPAIVVGNTHISYRDLLSKAESHAYAINQLAGRSNIIAISVDQGLYLGEAVFSVLASGNTYVMLDSSLPESRILHILEETQASMIVMDGENQQLLAEILPSSLLQYRVDHLPQEVKDFEAITHNPAYILYTSGSTGMPKGVVQNNKAILHFISGYNEFLNITENDRISGFSSPSFDSFNHEFFTALLEGAAYYPQSLKAETESEDLVPLINRYELTVLQFVPSVFRWMFEKENKLADSVRLVKMTGEASKVNDFELFKKISPASAEFIVSYGSSESTISTMKRLDHNSLIQTVNIPTGKPVANTQISIRRNGQLLGIGEVGEIRVSSPYVAKAYFKDPELSATIFEQEDGLIHYKTGDIGRINTDGELEILGRADAQTKIRGIRVNLAEAELQLLALDGISQAAVKLIQENNTSTLAAFIVGTSDNVTEIKQQLRKKLPDYLIPQKFVILDSLPRTKSGKIAYKELVLKESGKEDEKIKASGETELILEALWKETLAVNDLGIDDNFFELGGHSLKASAVISRVNKISGKKLKLRDLFESPTIRELARVIEAKAAEITGEIKVHGKIEQGRFPASSAQKRLFLIQQFDPSSTAYNMPQLLEVSGSLDVEKLEESIRSLVSENPVYRTTFAMENDQVFQQVSTSDFDHIKQVEVTDLQSHFMKSVKPFDLHRDRLFRIELWKNESKTYLFLDLHHIISDGSSIQLLIRDVLENYSGKGENKTELKYHDFALWQQEHGAGNEAGKKYWSEAFANHPFEALELPIDLPRPKEFTFKGSAIDFYISKTKIAAFKELLTVNGITLYSGLLAIYAILLRKYSGQRQLVIGSPVSGRTREELEEVHGLFANTVAFPMNVQDELSLLDYAAAVNQNVVQSFEHQDYPLEELIDSFKLEKDLSRNPLFDVMLAYQNMEQENPATADFELKPVVTETTSVKYDLTLLFADAEDGGLSVVMEFYSAIFREESVQGLIIHFERILDAFVANPASTVRDLSLVSGIEKENFLNDWGRSYSDVDLEKSVIDYFSETVAKFPSKIAVADAHKQWTYAELDEISDRVAASLLESETKSGELIAVNVSKNCETIAAFIGILKAGAAYLPIDPEHPEERKKFMLEDGAVRILIQTAAETLHYEGVSVLRMDQLRSDRINVRQAIFSTTPAYVIYTSGTTGKPKGVLVDHKAIVRLVKKTNFVNEDEHARLLQTGSLAFDAATFEIWWPLLNGGAVHLVEKSDLLNLPFLKKYLAEQQISHLWITTSFFHQLAQDDISVFTGLKYLGFGGERCLVQWVNKVAETYPELEFVHYYGPTENTTFSTYYRVTGKHENTVPIGKAIANSEVYILDEYRNLVPVGIPGIIYVGGEGLAKEYLNNPELTAEKFVNLPFAGTKKQYDSGDYGRWLPDGNIEFIGRKDSQIKLRGFRIELGEIEKALLEENQISAAYACVVELDGIQTLLAYVISDDFDLERTKKQLKEVLPDYMVPAHIIQVSEFPLTVNGKIRTGDLPLPDKKQLDFVQPASVTEKSLAAIWQELFDREEISLYDDFFNLGGHSLKVARLVNLVENRLQKSIHFKDVFRNPVLKDLAASIDQLDDADYESIPLSENKAHYRLSPAQERMMLTSGIEGPSTNYNISILVKAVAEIDLQRFENAWKQLINRHEILRSNFVTIGEEYRQIVHSEINFNVREFSCSSVEDFLEQALKPFDLANDHLLRVSTMNLDGETYFFFDFHHIIMDGESLKLLIAEFVQLYEGEELTALQAHYKDFAEWQSGRDYAAQLEFWKHNFEEGIPVLDLRTDRPRPKVRKTEGARVVRNINRDKTQAIKAHLQQGKLTAFSFFLNQLGILLHKFSGQEEIVVGIPVSGRTHHDLEEMIGMFVNSLPVKLTIPAAASLTDYQAETARRLLEALDHQDLPYEQLITELNVSRDASRNPLFDVFLTYQEAQKDQSINNLFEIVELDKPHTKFDLTFNIQEIGGEITVDCNYAIALFDKETIEIYLDAFLRLIELTIEDNNKQVHEISVLSPEAEQKLLTDFTRPSCDYPSVLIHEQFKAVSTLYGNQTALVFEDKTMTYGELESRSNQLAHYMRSECGVDRETIVGLLHSRGLEMIVSILAVLKAGGTYLPVDPLYPEDRIAYMLSDSECQLVLTESGLQIPLENVKTVDVSSLDLTSYPENSPENINKP